MQEVCNIHAYITEVPGLVIYARDAGFIRGVTQYKAVLIAICHKPLGSACGVVEVASCGNIARCDIYGKACFVLAIWEISAR